ncbi:MAG TPA: NAD(P)H-hydrate dehydratase [Chitinophagaceae bacterium]|nr:NAD(P)H-hydrate dehydratase [Chitinophagaceae bacterium]
MKILSAEEIRLWDQYTIEHEPITSIDLMERAAGKCVDWLEGNGYVEKSFSVFCGKGNNGGDGLAVARMLAEKKNKVCVYIVETGQNSSTDFLTNLERIKKLPVPVHFIQSKENFPEISEGDIIIDSIFGTGLNRTPEGLAAKTIEHINWRCRIYGNEIISVDMPTGMFDDISSKGSTIIKATHTLSFQCYKPAFLVAENSAYMGNVHILDIGLHPGFFESVSVYVPYEMIDGELISSIYKPRDPFAHKGKFGHALLVGGSYGKMGAAVLAAKACLRSGVGLLTCHIPSCGYEIMQRTVPEAMVTTDINSSVITKIVTDSYRDDRLKFTAVGIGPGMGTGSETKNALKEFMLATAIPMVLDADALNCIASDDEMFSFVPHFSILTPHPKEFERLFPNEIKNEFERFELAMAKAKELEMIIVLKGHHTLIATPEGKGYFNSTGNAGMAKGGSGDVLTGIITALVAQNYYCRDAAILGVYLHGLGGDITAKKNSQEAMIAGDIIENLGAAFSSLNP